MRRLIFQMMVTMDGYFEGPNKELDWHVWDDEMNNYANELLQGAGALLFGRVTYELMAAFWPTQQASVEDIGVTARMNTLPKYVFSNTLTTTNWNNTTIIKENAVDEIIKLKQLPAGNHTDLIIFGSSNLVTSLMPYNVINDYQLIVNPIILGSGKPLFEGIDQKQKFKVTDTRLFKTGNMLLNYNLI